MPKNVPKPVPALLFIWGDLDLIISTESPLEIVAFNGTIWPLIKAEFTSFPSSVWTSYAKSIGVDPSGIDFISPAGV